MGRSFDGSLLLVMPPRCGTAEAFRGGTRRLPPPEPAALEQIALRTGGEGIFFGE